MRKTPPNWLIWVLAGIVLVIFVGFSAGLAVTTFRQRASAPQPTRTPLALPTASRPGRTATRPAATATAAISAPATPTTSTSLPTSEAPTREPPTATPLPSPPPPTPTAERACTLPVAPEFTELFDAQVLGCPAADVATVWGAWETFEHGAMLWRSDTDAAYVLFDDGRWLEIAERWDGSAVTGRGAPPAGLTAPQRGFGWVWSRRDDVFAGLGWATAAERGFCAAVQPFEHGFILRSSAVASCTSDNLYNFATSPAWLPITLIVYPAGWSETRPAETARVSNTVRPLEQGVFTAPQLDTIVLDGYPDEWPDAWQPVTAVVEGANNWIGKADLAGEFQVAWAPAGIYLAVRVIDDVYQTGPDGADMWRGDSLEINFDRDLIDDADASTSDADDYQIGLSYGPNLALMRAYRWLPFAKEGALTVTGAVISTIDGYTVEALIPWGVFEVPATGLAPGRAFGFNLALNDNDDAAAASQQTVAASSPARTTYDNPSQWGELVLQ